MNVVTSGMRPSAHLCVGQLCLQCRAEGLDGDHPAFLALIFKRQ